MRRGAAVVAVGAAMGWLALGPAGGEAQEARAPGAEALVAQAGSGPGGAAGPGGGMMGQGMMGGMMGPGARHGMGGPHGPMDPMGGTRHLEHLMVHHPKEAARVMRFRADLYRALAEVLARHAAELEK